MTDSIFDIIRNSVLGKRFRNIGYLPRWIIFSIDVFIILIAVLVAMLIIISLSVTFFSPLSSELQVAIIVIVNAICFAVYRTYAGIIRHSTFIDGVKLLVSTTTAYFVMLVINYTSTFFYDHQFFLTTGLFISYVISFLLLFLFRIMVKFFFEQYMQIEGAKSG